MGAVATIAGGFIYLRKTLSSDSVERAGNDGLLQIIELLRAQVDREAARADAAVAARDDAVTQIGLLRNQVTQLSAQVENLQKLLSAAGVVARPPATT
jgi:predicted ArsR family transcriptional regulator